MHQLYWSNRHRRLHKELPNRKQVSAQNCTVKCSVLIQLEQSTYGSIGNRADLTMNTFLWQLWDLGMKIFRVKLQYSELSGTMTHSQQCDRALPDHDADDDVIS